MGSRRIARTRSLSSYLNSLDNSTLSSSLQINANNSIATNSIGESSLAEELQIFDKTVQSGNYVEGYSGWKITGTGNAEFGNVVVRGNINASSGTIGYWNISNPAVSRVIGSTTLLGTFLESAIAGDNDEGITSGTYVGLFKSYTPDPVQVTNKERVSNVAILTSEGHDFQVGDLVIVSLEDDTTFNNSGSPVTITAVTLNDFSYANTGTDVATSSSIGIAELDNDDIAGLYLKDYAKTEFDYGYFSNKGMKYVSAEKLNLIHNPSFEYIDPNSFYNGVIASSAGWEIVDSGSTITGSTLDILYGTSTNPRFNAYSGYGYQVTNTGGSTPSTSSYALGTIDYLAAKNYNLFTNDRTLNFNFDLFFTQSQEPVGGQINYANIGRLTVNSKTLTTPSATLTTDQPHGRVVGDSVTVTGVDTVVNVTNKARTLTTVTLTFASTTHKIIVGDSITVAISDANYDGTYTVATQSATTITYAKTSASIQATTAASGTITHNLFNGTYTLTGVTSNTFSYSKSHATYTATAVTGTAQFTDDYIYINTSTAHGLTAGDIVYVNAELYDDVNSLDYSSDFTTPANGRAHVVQSVPSSTWFRYVNTDTSNTSFGVIAAAGAASIGFTTFNVSQSGSGTYTYTVTFADENHPFIVGSYIWFEATDQFGVQPTWANFASNPKLVTAVTDRSISYESVASDYDPSYSYYGTVYWGKPYAYKTFSPSYDMSAIKIQYGDDISATSDLYDVLTTTSQGLWASLSRRSDRAKNVMSRLVDGGKILELTATDNSNLEISSKKLLDAYTLTNPTGLSAEENIYIRFPGYLDKYDITNTTSSGSVISDSTGRNVGFVIDNVQITTSSEFFYGDSSDSGHYWYSDATAATLGPDQASVKNSKDWLDIDLTTQTASLQFDNISITEKYFSKQLMSYAELTSIPGSSAYDPVDTGASMSGLALSSANYEYLNASVPSEPRFLKTTINQFVGDGVSGIELLATENIYDGTPSDTLRRAGLGFWLSSTEGYQGATMTIYADAVSFAASDPSVLTPDPPLYLGYYSGTNDVDGSFVDPGAIPDEFTHAVFVRTNTAATSSTTSFTVQATGTGVLQALTAGSCYATFRTGPSGISQITIFSRGASSSATGFTVTSFGIYKFVGYAASGYPLIGGAVLIPPSNNHITSTGGTLNTGSSYTYLFSGDPNTSYVVAHAVRMATAGTATFAERAITVVPVM